MKTRREFLKSGCIGLAATWTLPAFLSKTIFTLDLQAADALTQSPSGADGPILVVLQMGGGNDGLSTVIPFAQDAYYKSRAKLGIPADKILKLNAAAEFGLNPNLTGLKELYDSGNLALLNGVGYPNPNRSHFRSMEIWQTASDSDKSESYGWLGRYFDNACAGTDPTVGINLGSMPPQAFLGPKPLGIAMASPDRYRLMESGGSDKQVVQEFYEALNKPQTGAFDNNVSGGSVQDVGMTANHDTAISNLDYLQRTAMDAELSSREIQTIAKKAYSGVTYPPGQLSNDLRLVARLIGGGLKTRIYYVNQGGYDTHANQQGTHSRLMTDLSGALSAFAADLKAQGNFDRVLLMTFSEFGRRVQENASGGTDHGVAGPMFVMGGKVKAGTYGQYPSLADLDHGDLRHNLDFRSVYATVLDRWLKADSAAILKRKFDSLDFV